MRIFALLDAHLDHVAAVLAGASRRPHWAERRSADNIVNTVAASVEPLFLGAGLSPEAAEVAAKCYAMGWLDAAHRETAPTLADAVLRHRQQPTSPSRLLLEAQRD